MHNMKVTGTRTKDMPMVKKKMQVVQAMKVNGAMIRKKDMVFIPLKVEKYMMGLLKMTKCMGLDSRKRMDNHSKQSILKASLLEL